MARNVYLRAPMPAVSVIIPVYKVEPYVARCARSLFDQTQEDIEYIFVDDCTPDRSIEIVKEVMADYPKRKEQVQFVRTPRNGGLARARVFGLKHAKGDYIIHCDSDDAVKPDAYRLMYEKAVAEDLDIVTCDFEIIWGGGKSIVQSQYSEPGREIGDILNGKVWSTVWSRMSRRYLWNDIIVPKGDMLEDMVFTIQIINQTSRVGFLPIPLYLYHRRLGTISLNLGTQAVIRQWKSHINNAEQVLSILSSITPVTWKPSDVTAFKYSCRGSLTRYIQIPEFYRRWRNTFPEVDSAFLWTSGISSQKKIDYCLIRLHLFYLWKKSYRNIRRLLRVIYYRVFFGCTPPVC